MTDQTYRDMFLAILHESFGGIKSTSGVAVAMALAETKIREMPLPQSGVPVCTMREPLHWVRLTAAGAAGPVRICETAQSLQDSYRIEEEKAGTFALSFSGQAMSWHPSLETARLAAEAHRMLQVNGSLALAS